jgi:hypothetical protein
MTFEQLLNQRCIYVPVPLGESYVEHVDDCAGNCQPVPLPNEDVERILDCLYDPNQEGTEKRMAAYNKLRWRHSGGGRQKP